MKTSHFNKGFVVSMAAFFVLLVMIATALAMSMMVFFRQQMATNASKSVKSYYAAEAGIEDALIRVKNNPQMSSLNYSLAVGTATNTISISAMVGGSRTIDAEGDTTGIKRKIRAIYGLNNGTNASFYYGAQVGAGGLVMGSGSRIMGNVFSGGNITGSGTIDNNAVVSGNGHSITGVKVKGDASAYSCLAPATIDGNLTYVTGGTKTCTVSGTTTQQSNEIEDEPLPIPQSQISAWKNEASEGQVISGNYTISNNKSISLGPAKITGNLVISNNSTLTLTGTVYVAGNITLSNNITIRLSSSYGGTGGVFMADGNISIGNNVIFEGSGQSGSYVLVLSNSTSSSAITVSNNAENAVLYASAGTLNIANNVSVVEATGYKVSLSNNATIEYSNGLVNIYFADGTGGGLALTSWQEQ